jgi:hypothetical protein
MLRPLAAEKATDSKLLDRHHWFVLAVAAASIPRLHRLRPKKAAQDGLTH